MIVRLTQLDGALPNLALMRLSHWHKSQGDQVHVTREAYPSLWEPEYDRVYVSTIFDFTRPKLQLFMQQWPDAISGGTGSFSKATVEQIAGGSYEQIDYSGFPDFDASIGYTQRGCRMAGPKSPCRDFCVVPEKEGFPYSVNRVSDIWRGDPWPRKIHLLDNDFFGNPEWRERVEEIVSGGFKVCFSQGINTRLITDETAQAMARMEYRNTKFNERKLYTAWDNVGDEGVFFRGVECLERAGIPPRHLMVYMLIGSDITETWERIWYRFKRMVDLGIEPYPMVKNRDRKDFLCFQRWVITGLYRIIPWDKYERETKTEASVEGWNKVYGIAIVSLLD